MTLPHDFLFKQNVLTEFVDLRRAVLDAIRARRWEAVSIVGAGKNGQLLFSLLQHSSIRIDAVYDDKKEASLGSLRAEAVELDAIVARGTPLILAANNRPWVDSMIGNLRVAGIPWMVFSSIRTDSGMREARKPPSEEKVPRMSLEGSLGQLKSAGFCPGAIVDIGAAFGHWTLQAGSMFPGVPLIMVEPLEKEFGRHLREAKRRLQPTPVEIVYAAAAESEGERTINVHSDWTSSSLMKEHEGPMVDGAPRTVRCVTVDEVVRKSGLSAPLLLKVDTQGYEHQVLAGAGRSLALIEVLILEVSFFRFFKEGLLFKDILDCVYAKGFVLHDILTCHYRFLDRALAQADVLFVQSGSSLRAIQDFATPAQRREKVASFLRSVQKMKRS